jgi:hypothetical protein
MAEALRAVGPLLASAHAAFVVLAVCRPPGAVVSLLALFQPPLWAWPRQQRADTSPLTLVWPGRSSGVPALIVPARAPQRFSNKKPPLQRGLWLLGSV